MSTEPSITADDIIKLIAHTAAGETERAADVLTHIATVGGVRALYAASCAVTEAIVQLAGLQPGGVEDFIALEITGPNGQSTNPGEVPDRSQALVWAGQFIAAHANGQSDQTMALFLAARSLDADPSDPDLLIARICRLITIAAGAVQQKAGTR